MQGTLYFDEESPLTGRQFNANYTQARSFKFSGSNYVPKFDKARLTGQLLRIYEAMKDGQYRTLDEIHRITGDPHASISAQLRNLRKESFGSHQVDKRSRGDRESGLFEYRLVVSA